MDKKNAKNRLHYKCYEDYFNNEYMNILEREADKKNFLRTYNLKQVLIQALMCIGIEEKYAKNEILHFNLIEDFKEELEISIPHFSIPPGPYDVSDDYYDNKFKIILNKYIEFLREKLIIENNCDSISISYYDTSYKNKVNKANVYFDQPGIFNKYNYDIKYDTKKIKSLNELNIYLKNVINDHRYEQGNINIKNILIDDNNDVKVTANSTEVLGSYNKSYFTIISETFERKYNYLYMMTSISRYRHCRQEFDDINDFSIASINLCNSINNAMYINPDYKTCKYVKVVNNQVYDTDVDLIYECIDYSFSTDGYFNINGPYSLEKNGKSFNNLNYLDVDLRFIEMLLEREIDPSLYLVKENDANFYSRFYDFSSTMFYEPTVKSYSMHI